MRIKITKEERQTEGEKIKANAIFFEGNFFVQIVFQNCNFF
jgi:hypothetical protein